VRILYISNSVIPSRTANSIHVMKMCKAFAENGHEVTLLAPDKKNEYEKNIENIYEYYGVKNNFTVKKLWCLNIKGKSLLYTLNIFVYLLFNINKVDLVYGRFTNGCYISTLLKIKTIFESHSPTYDNIWLENFFFKKMVENEYFVKLIVISESLKNLYVTNNALSSSKIQVAHDGADKVNNFELKARLYGDNDCFKVGYVGHLYKGRGIELIIECAKKLQNVTFHIVGGSKEDIGYWGKYIKSIYLKNIYFYGFVSPKDAIYYRNAFDIFLAPYGEKVCVYGNTGDSSQFMSPLKIFEYMSHKKPIISSNLSVLREVLNRKNSILVDYNDIEQWTDAILSLNDNIIMRNNIANQAYYDFINKYTWKERAKNVISE